MAGPSSDDDRSPRARVAVGRFGAPHGVRGEVRLKSYTQEPLGVARYATLGDNSGARRFALRNARHIKDDMLVVAVAGVSDRGGAEALRNLELFVDRAELPAPDEDEFYLVDLIGLRCELADGSPFGVVAHVLNYGAGDILDIRDGQGATRLLPFTRAVVPVVDMQGRRIVVAPPSEIEPDAPHDRG